MSFVGQRQAVAAAKVPAVLGQRKWGFGVAVAAVLLAGAGFDVGAAAELAAAGEEH